jgi:hypothetical protein
MLGLVHMHGLEDGSLRDGDNDDLMHVAWKYIITPNRTAIGACHLLIASPVQKR